MRIGYIKYINLDERADRAAHMDQVCSSLGISFGRFSAIAPSVESLVRPEGKFNSYYVRAVPRVKQYLKNRKTMPRGVGIFGCFISHHMVLKSLDPDRVSLIMEDDVSVSPRAIEVIEQYMSSHLNGVDWDILRVMWRNSYRWMPIKHCLSIKYSNDLLTFRYPHKELKDAKPFRRHNIFGGTHFYLVNGKKLEEISQYLEAENVTAMDAVLSTNKINVFLLPKRLYQDADVKEESFGTDIPKLQLD